MNFAQIKSNMEKCKNDLQLLNQKAYMNYSVKNGKIYGVPLKGQETYKGCLELVSDYIKHELFFQAKIELLDLQSSIFNHSDSKLNKERDNLRSYHKRFKNALRKLEKESKAS